MTWAAYGRDLEANLRDLHARVHSGAYRASPSRRVYIPKADGRLRPLGIAALEDKILQRAVVEVLNAIYEEDFLGFSYGFRPGRSPHDALDALAVGIERKKVNWVLDADIRDFFTSLDHDWLQKFLEHRIADRRVLRLIQKWLSAGVIEEGNWSETDVGSPQGASVSPLLANVYLHYVFDLWARQWRRRHARGDMIVVRFADDFVVGFQHLGDAQTVPATTFANGSPKFGLELHPDKTRLIEFGRFAARNRARRGARETGDVRLPGLHAHLREGEKRTLLAPAHHHLETDAGQAGRRQRPAQTAPASAHPRTGPLAGERGARPPRLLRRARQHQRRRSLPGRGHPALVQSAPAPQPAPPPHLGADATPRTSMAPSTRILHPYPACASTPAP